MASHLQMKSWHIFLSTRHIYYSLHEQREKRDGSRIKLLVTYQLYRRCHLEVRFHLVFGVVLLSALCCCRRCHPAVRSVASASPYEKKGNFVWILASRDKIIRALELPCLYVEREDSTYFTTGSDGDLVWPGLTFHKRKKSVQMDDSRFFKYLLNFKCP